ncbi:MAG: glycosyltransferase family 2 protein [Candidatus Gastranaerophilales bacterium]|nr:glycosyltransferase family 2 protein [Candidatus Gastranaerophilales bacterium]
MDISIIICSYNTCTLIRDCLNSIFENTLEVDFEVSVVDNNSSDNTVAMIREEFPQVKLIANTENKGFAKANNQAAKLSMADYVMFLNPDTKLRNNAVKILVDFVRSSDAPIAGALLFGEDGKKTHSFGHLHTIKSLICTQTPLKYLFKKERIFYNSYEQKFSHEPFEVEYITGADLVIKRNVLQELGYFSEKFFMYFEDTHLGFMARKCGYKAFLVPQAEIYHFEGKSKLPKKQLKALESKFLYYKLCYGILGYLPVLLMMPKYLKFWFKAKN